MAARDRTRASDATAGLPAELAGAINRAAAANPPVTPAMLVGIWRIESGSTFPNNFKNRLGYGGLFGTTDWNGPTQEQANYSASILSRLIRQHQGSISAALYAYSGGGYSSVPGAGGTAFGSRGPRPSGVVTSSSYSGSSGGGGIGGFLDAAGNVVASPFEAIWGGISSTADFLKAALWLIDPRNWLRAIEGIVGFVLILLGLYFLGTADGSGTSAAKSMPLPLPGVGTLAKAAVKGEKRARAARASRKGGGSSSSSSSAGSGAGRERRAEEMHREKVRTQRARTAEIARRSRHQRRTVGEQQAAERRAFIHGATEQAATSETAKRSARRRAKRRG